MKKILTFIFSFILFILNVRAIDINSSNAILYNLNDDKVIYEKQSDERIQVASLTKIMTTIVAIENIENLDEYIVLDSKSFHNLEGYAKAGFKIGDRVTIRDLLYAIVLPSGAEAAQAIAIRVSGSIDEFVNLMNEKVEELGLKNTYFDNPIGKDSSNNYSTVEDIALILKYALKNDTFKEIFTTKEYTTTNGIKLSSTLSNKAKFLNLDASFILGSKTGTTYGAGLCLASISNLSDINYLLVTCGAPYESNNYPYNVLDAINIYNFYNENYGYKTLIDKTQLLVNLKVKKSTIKNLDIFSDKDVEVYVKNEVNKSNIEYKYNGIEVIDYTYKKGDKLGTLDVIYEGDVLYTYDIILNTDIKKFPYYIIYISISIFVLIVITIMIKIHKQKKLKIKRYRKR